MNLQLPLKKKWFDMTKAGIKTEDYREITPYWSKRLILQSKDINWDTPIKIIDKICDNYFNNKNDVIFRPFTTNIMTLGYPKKDDKSRILTLEHKGIEIRTGNPEWGAEPDKLYFVILHGEQQV
jgi:hypothetical protein